MKRTGIGYLSFAAGIYGFLVGTLLILLNAHMLHQFITLVFVSIYFALLCFIPTALVVIVIRYIWKMIFAVCRKPVGAVNSDDRREKVQSIGKEPSATDIDITSPSGNNGSMKNTRECKGFTNIMPIVIGVILVYTACLYWYHVREFQSGLPELTLRVINLSGWIFLGFGLIQILGVLTVAVRHRNPECFREHDTDETNLIKSAIKNTHGMTFMFITSIIPMLIVFIATSLLVRHYNHETVPAATAARFQTDTTGKYKSTTRLIFVGWDGASWDILDPLLRSGKMPNLQKILGNSVRGELHSMRPTQSPSVWTTIYSGKTARQHRITGFSGFRQSLFLPEPLPNAPVHLVNSVSEFIILEPLNKLLKITERLHIWQLYLNSRFNKKAEMIWDILSHNGYSVGVVNPMISIPAEPVTGFLVTDYLRHGITASPEMVYPKSLVPVLKSQEIMAEQVTSEMLARFFTDRTAASELLEAKTSRDKNKAIYATNLQRAYAEDISTARIAKLLLAQYKPQVAVIYFHGTDIVSHHFWKYLFPEKFWRVSAADVRKYQNIIPRYYEFLDELLAEFMPTGNEDTLFILCSDHGFEAVTAPMEVWSAFTGLALSGNHYHAPNGIIVIQDQHLTDYRPVNGVTITDITPTILWRLGLPVAKDMDGKVLTQIYPAGFIAQHPVQTIQTYERPRSAYSDSEPDITTPEAKERLESLGYISR